jgi:hypothetical protein
MLDKLDMEASQPTVMPKVSPPRKSRLEVSKLKIRMCLTILVACSALLLEVMRRKKEKRKISEDRKRV